MEKFVLKMMNEYGHKLTIDFSLLRKKNIYLLFDFGLCLSKEEQAMLLS
jgi:hypothetical protein